MRRARSQKKSRDRDSVDSSKLCQVVVDLEECLADGDIFDAQIADLASALYCSQETRSGR